MGWTELLEAAGPRVATRRGLASLGVTDRMLTAATRSGDLIRAREGVYVAPGEADEVVQAATLGGILGCVSALRDDGVFGFESDRVHVHVRPGASRLRRSSEGFERASFRRASLARSDGSSSSPSRTRPLREKVHWGRLRWPEAALPYRVGVKDALLQVLSCQEPWLAVASIDSALFQRRIDRSGVSCIFAEAPKRLRKLERLVDGRSESGQESVLRLIVERAGFSYVLQPFVPGVGRVDMIVENSLVVEADSRAFHGGWEKQESDRRRDAVAAARGMPTLRLVYPMIMNEHAAIVRAIDGMLRCIRHRPGCRIERRR